jgi:hypothetical protein
MVNLNVNHREYNNNGMESIKFVTYIYNKITLKRIKHLSDLRSYNYSF